MKKPKYRGGQVEGKENEDKHIKNLDEAGIEYIREHLAHSKATAKRAAGETDLIIEGWLYLELKSVGKNKMSYRLHGDKEGYVIKPHQLSYLYRKWYTEGKEAGLLLTYRPHKSIYIRIEDFYRFAGQNTGKSLTYYDARIIGREIDSIVYLVKECKQ